MVTEEEESLSAALDEARIRDEGQEVQARRRLTRKQQELVRSHGASNQSRIIHIKLASIGWFLMPSERIVCLMSTASGRWCGSALQID